jgi:hypothetical protein
MPYTCNVWAHWNECHPHKVQRKVLLSEHEKLCTAEVTNLLTLFEKEQGNACIGAYIAS